MTVLDRPPLAASRHEQARSRVESSFRTFDGTELFYRAWLPAKIARRCLILLHRGHEHCGRFAGLVERLALPDDAAVFAYDARGHGRSPGERGYAQAFATLVKDADSFARYVSRTHQIEIGDMIVLGHSVGAMVAAAWVHDYAPPVRGLVMATPALSVRLYVPLAMPSLRALGAVRRTPAFIKSYVRSGMLTHDAEQARAYDADPLISKQIAVNVLIELRDTADRLVADAGAIRVPTLIQTAGSDWVVDNRAATTFFDRLGSTAKAIRHYDGFGHAIYHEADRAAPIADVRSFVLRAFERTPDNRTLLHADRTGYTRAEFERLCRPLSRWSPRRLALGAQRIAMKSGGRLSKGIDLGWRTGFSSGESLDHVYANTAAGITPIGKLVDRLYLNAIGWRGIRQRKVHLMRLLWHAIDMTAARGEPVRVLDIASGPGRYMLEVLGACEVRDVHARLRDRSEGGLQAGRALARTMGVTNVTYEAGDAFDTVALAALAPRPNIAVVSGLFELFPDNGPVRGSLAGLACAIAPGGYLIYTNQPWHPQVEMIARVLTHANGSPWIMRRRTQAEMDELVRAAGFEKVEMEIDKWGIFTVSLARRT